MTKLEFLYWYRDDPKRQLKIDVEWATIRFQKKFNKQPEMLLVNPKEENQFVGFSFNVKGDNKIQKGYFGVA